MNKESMTVKNQLFMKSLIITMLLICIPALRSWAQNGKLFNTDNQLSSNLATQVYQDHNGFIWITTRNGLNTYDGYNISVMKKNTPNAKGLNSNYINCIAEDAQGQILLGTNNSLLVFDGNEFHKIPMLNSKNETLATYVTQVYRLSNKDVAIGTSGYGILLLKQNGKDCHAMRGEVEKLKHIRKMQEDKLGRLWIITEDGKLHRKECSGKILSVFPELQGLTAQDLLSDPWGNVYLATKYTGVYVLKAGTHAFTKIPTIANIPIDDIYLSRNNRLFIGSDGMGIYVYDPRTGLTQDNPLFSRQMNLAKSKVTSIIEDNQGNIWVSMLQKGVFMQANMKNDFNYMGFRLGDRNVIGENSVTSLCVNQGDQVWVGTDKDGLYLFSMASQTIQGHYMGQATVLAVCKDDMGRTWVGTYTDGLGYLDPAGNYHPVDIGIPVSVGIFDIKKDAYGNLWISTMGAGLYCLNKDGSRKNYRARYGAENNSKINCIPNDYLTKIALSRDGSKVYVATSVGLACLDRKKNSWLSTFRGTNCLIKNSFSHCVFTDSKDQVWYGTEDGVYCFDFKKSIKPKKYTVANGLTDNSVASIAEDYKGRIWLGTTCGLSKLNPENGKITKFFTENGLQSNEFSDASVCTAWNGKVILMGGSGGLNWFQADKVKQHPWKANVFISGFLLGNKHVAPGMESGAYTITEDWVNSSKEFNLSHEDNSFTLQLSTLTYNNVEQISYAYSINGEDWRMVQPGVNELSFSHMPAGKYKFRIKAICNGYETPIREFTIHVHPVWYASFWAKLVYLLLFIGLCVAYMEHRKRKEEDRLTLQKHIHAEEMGEAKLKFFMNISHEIRTPLTLILTPLLSLIKEDKDVRRQGIYDIMRKNSERILHLINQMMDLRKIDKGQMKMLMSETNMVAFIDDEYQLFHQQALAKSIDFQYVHDSEQLSVWIDRNNFDKVLMNVLSNAFKFTPTGGKVKITLTHSEHHAYISIKDSGKGIDKDKLETIFQRFYQSPTSSTDRNIGTGIGLDLTRSLVELHYGTIVARNNEGGDDADFQQGSEFLVTLPLGNEHLKKEEIVTESEEKEVEEKEKSEMAELQVDDTLDDNLLDGNASDGNAADGNASVDGASNASSKAGTGGASLKSANPEKFSKTKSTLAIVEDDEEIQAYLKAQLGEDFNILAYPNGKMALQGILTKQPDLVISDIMMPEMDGNTLCTKLKNNVNSNHIPVILLTAMSREEDQLEGLQTGADAYLMKPFNMDILRRTILNLLSVRRTLRNKFEGNEDQTSKIENVEMQSPDNALMDRIMSVINENLEDSDLSVDMIAQKVGISRVHLHRKMKELTNQTPHSFIRNVRLKQAAQLLRESKYNITDVMYRCGFSNAASFSTMFKNLYGQSPRDYMMEHRK